LIDAYALIYRAYYALIKNPRINSKGFYTSAILGFVNILEDILKSQSPTHIAVCFDPSGPTFRHEAYPQYKAQREATPEDIRASVPILKDLISAYNIPILEVSGFEADDVVGTVSKIAEKNDFTVFMLTPDKDYAQLVSENIFIYRPKHGGGYETLGVEGVKDEMLRFKAADGVLVCEGGLENGDVVSLYNIGGVLVASSVATSHKVALPVAGLPHGSYLVVVKSAAGTRVHKVVL
jgi:5'-3' exonuclease